MRWRSAVLAFIALGGLVLSTARAPTAAGQTFRGFRLTADGCVGSSSMFVLSLSRAQGVVPQPFRVYDYAGLGVARATIRATRCTQVRIDGGPPAPAVFSSVLIDLNPPQSAEGESGHYYELWRVDGSGELRQAFSNAGMTGDALPAATLSQPSPAPLTVVQAAVPWPRAPLSLVHTAPDPTSGVPLLLKESAWHKGPFGTFRTFTSSVESQHAGAAGVQVGGELATLLGGLPGAILPGFVRNFSFNSRVEAQTIKSNPLTPK